MTDAANASSTLIAALANADPGARQSAAAALYRDGRALADAGVARWRSDAELAASLTGAATVGVAVLPENFDKIRAANASPSLAEVPPDQDAKEFELHFAGNVALDILTTVNPGGNGAIARFLQRFGQGIQQVEYVVKDVDRATEILRSRMGQQPVYPQTRPGADGTRVNFFLAGTTDGKKVLIELVELPRQAPEH